MYVYLFNVELEKTAQGAVPVKKQKKLSTTSCRFYKAELIEEFKDLALVGTGTI